MKYNRPPTMIKLRVRSLPIANVYSIFVLAATTLLLQVVKADDEYLCETVDCVNGMFNQANCSCECIPPFCPDIYGNCIVSGTCDDPWADCERGVNCPWWKNPSKAESCDTGALVRSSVSLSLISHADARNIDDVVHHRLSYCCHMLPRLQFIFAHQLRL